MPPPVSTTSESEHESPYSSESESVHTIHHDPPDEPPSPCSAEHSHGDDHANATGHLAGAKRKAESLDGEGGGHAAKARRTEFDESESSGSDSPRSESGADDTAAAGAVNAMDSSVSADEELPFFAAASPGPSQASLPKSKGTASILYETGINPR